MDFTIIPQKSAPLDKHSKKVKLDERLFGATKEGLFKPFLLMLLAPVRSGKSVSIVSLLYQKPFEYKKLFKQVYFISPTLPNDDSLYLVREDDDIIGITDIDSVDMILEQIIEQQIDEVERDKILPPKLKQNQQILIIMDDMIGMLGKKTGYFNSFLTRYRHYKVSLIITSQKFRELSPIARVNTGYWMVFKSFNAKEKEAIVEELSGTFDGFESHLDTATKEKYNFLYVDMEKGRLWKNFNELLFEDK